MNQLFKMDYERFTPHKYKFLPALIRRIRNHGLNFLYFGRKYQLAKNGVAKRYFLRKIKKHARKYGLEIYFTNVGGGLKLLHPYNITVNSLAKIGENVTLFKGCVIGEIVSGEKAGYPTICDGCTIYANAVVVGNITIGENSEIAAGAFVNFDVPPNSVVIGNPGIIHARKR